MYPHPSADDEHTSIFKLMLQPLQGQERGDHSGGKKGEKKTQAVVGIQILALRNRPAPPVGAGCAGRRGKTARIFGRRAKQAIRQNKYGERKKVPEGESGQRKLSEKKKRGGKQKMRQ